jgi:hypothetical protein
MSAHAPDGLVALGSKARPVPLLRKPFTLTELAAVLERVLETQVPVRQAPLAG